MILSLVLVAMSGGLNAVMDTLQFHYSTSVFSYFNPKFWDTQISSWNKYKDGDKNKGSAFLGSTTFFVFITDAWHLFQSLFLLSIIGAIVFYTTLYGQLWDFVLLSVLFRAVFQVYYWGFRV